MHLKSWQHDDTMYTYYVHILGGGLKIFSTMLNGAPKFLAKSERGHEKFLFCRTDFTPLLALNLIKIDIENRTFSSARLKV